MKKHLRLALISLFSLAGIILVSFLAHNFIYALSGVEEPVFFMIAVLSIIIFPIVAIVTTILVLLTVLKRDDGA